MTSEEKQRLEACTREIAEILYRTHLGSFRTKYIAFMQPLTRQFDEFIGSWGFVYRNG
jgi:hypothetical protein